jgi:threonine synthase
MDILASSNFERLLWYLERGDSRQSATGADEVLTSKRLVQHMSNLQTSAGFSVDQQLLDRCKLVFQSTRVNDSETSDCLTRYYKNTGMILDPHTAVGVVAAERLAEDGVVDICLATAHPGKFPDAVLAAVNSEEAKNVEWKDFAPKVLVEAMDMPKRCIHLETEGGRVDVATEKVKEYLSRILDN